MPHLIPNVGMPFEYLHLFIYMLIIFYTACENTSIYIITLYIFLNWQYFSKYNYCIGKTNISEKIVIGFRTIYYYMVVLLYLYLQKTFHKGMHFLWHLESHQYFSHHMCERQRASNLLCTQDLILFGDKLAH